MWRALLVGVLAGFISGAIIGFILGMIGISLNTIQIICGGVGFVLGSFFSIAFMKKLLRTKFKTFSINVEYTQEKDI